MAKAAKGQKFDKGIPVTGYNPAPWHETVGTYIAGQAELDELNMVAHELERKWGVDRLRMLVPPDMRVKFDRQRYLLNQAIWYGDLHDVIREARRAITAWKACDRVAEASGSSQRAKEVWEVEVGGLVAAIVPDEASARLVRADGRHLVIYTLDEIGRLLNAYPEIVRAKQMFEGAEVIRTGREPSDPLAGVPDSIVPIDGHLNDPLPEFMGGM